MTDEMIIRLFADRNESAISETDKKYGKLLRAVASSVLCDDGEAEEVVNDTYLRLWNTVPSEIPENLRAFSAAVCRNLALSRYRGDHSQKRSGSTGLALDELEECVTGQGGEITDIGETVALRNAISSFLDSLPKKTRTVFLLRYWYMASVSEIANRLSMKENHVAVNLCKTRKKLKKYLKKEGFDYDE